MIVQFDTSTMSKSGLLISCHDLSPTATVFIKCHLSLISGPNTIFVNHSLTNRFGALTKVIMIIVMTFPVMTPSLLDIGTFT